MNQFELTLQKALIFNFSINLYRNAHAETLVHTIIYVLQNLEFLGSFATSTTTKAADI